MRSRRSLVCASGALLLVMLIACDAYGQAGRVWGRVKDAESGQPLKGATVTAENPQAIPTSFTAVSDDKGRFTIIGMRSGTWLLTASAPGYVPLRGSTRVQAFGGNPPVEFALGKAPEPIVTPLSGVDVKALQADLTAAEALMDTGRYDEAVAGYRAILDKLPALTTVHIQIGHAHRARKDYAAAIAAYNEVPEDDPAAEGARVAVAMTEAERGDLDAADRLLTTLCDDPHASPEAMFSLGEIRRAKGDTGQAAAWYRKAAETDPAWPRPLVRLGRLSLEQGDAPAATAHLEKALTLESEGPDADEARQLLERARKELVGRDFSPAGPTGRDVHPAARRH
jgi:Flp pilus assembly protein TadD